MAAFLNFFQFGSRPFQSVVSPNDEDDGSTDGHARKALLEGQDDYDSTESPPPYRSKQTFGGSLRGFAVGIAAATLLFGLLAACIFWRTPTLYTQCSRIDSKEALPPGDMTTKTRKPYMEDETDSTVPIPAIPEGVFTGWKDCGSNVTEARAKGCKFDVMLHSWVNEECFDQELMDEYLDKVPYHWYRDWKAKDEITVDEMRLGEHEHAAVKLEEHGTHCAYVLEKNLRAIMSGKTMARSIYSIKHAVHCIGLIVDPQTIPGDYTLVVVEYDQCGIPSFA